MSLAPWRSPLARALHQGRRRPDSRYLQLATVGLDGNPDNRTVVFRGFVDGENQLKIITDSRSDKIEQLTQNPRAALCWYFSESREQFRFWGTMTVIDGQSTASNGQDFQQLRQATWQGLSDNARAQFGWPDPGSPRPNAKQPFSVKAVEQSQPPDVFVLLLFSPDRVDHLKLKGNPQSRTFYYLQRNDSEMWETQAVHP